jgi:hypothetical protein
MTESILPVSAEPITETATALQLSDTATAPPVTPDSCQLQRDALRGAMVDCKKAMNLVKERQDAWFQCQHGISLKGLGINTPTSVYNAGIGMNSGLKTMLVGLDTVSINSGVRIED